MAGTRSHVMRSYPTGDLAGTVAAMALFRDVFGEQITFCFGNLTVSPGGANTTAAVPAS